jgi:hypothetical protein
VHPPLPCGLHRAVADAEGLLSGVPARVQVSS